MGPESFQRENIEHVADVWKYLWNIRQAVTTRIKQILVDPDDHQRAVIAKAVLDETGPLGDTVCIPRSLQKMWTSDEASGTNRTFPQYAHYLSNTFSDTEDVRTFLETYAERGGPGTGYCKGLMQKHPLVGLAAAGLSLGREGKEFKITRPYQAWLQDVLDLAERSKQGIEHYFGACRERLEGGEEQEILGPFLNDWQSDLELTVAECINMANCFAIHAQDPNEDCAVYMGAIPFPYKNMTKREGRERIAELGRFKAYTEYYPDFFNKRFAKKDHAFIPTMLSVADIPDFLQFFHRYWHSLRGSLGKTTVRSFPRSHAQMIGLKETANVLCRPWPEDGKQARIALMHRSPDFDDFHLRIDEGKRGRLTFDFGSIDFQDVLAYAEEVGRESAQSEIIEKYSLLVDETGVLCPTRESRSEYYPSIMKSTAPISKGKKASLVGSVVAHAGEKMGMRKHSRFSYHFQEHVAEGHRRRGHPFSTVVRLFAETLGRNALQ